MRDSVSVCFFLASIEKVAFGMERETRTKRQERRDMAYKTDILDIC